MSLVIDSTTLLPIGDPNICPLSHPLPTHEDVLKSLDTLILSASGWRKVFASSGKDEDASSEIGKIHCVIAAHMANVFVNYLQNKIKQSNKLKIVLAMDSRPTGTEIADIMCRVLISRGCDVHFVFISAAPEAMAYAKLFDGFVYISASHNPIGHNGVKFGLNDGGVLPGSEAVKLIELFTKDCTAPDSVINAFNLVSACPKETLIQVWSNTGVEKKLALETYEAFSREVLSGTKDTEKAQSFFNIFSNAALMQKKEGKPISILADFNGSARSCSIDRPFFESCGIHFFSMHEKPRDIAHRIVPEGDSLSFAANEINNKRQNGTTEEEKNIVFGYMPDCDGDRGNIVFWNEKSGKTEILAAQEVFALSVIAELTHLVYLDQIQVTQGKPCVPQAAVAINDPTSLRIEEIAEAFGVHVARAEVGEANVVNLARNLRENGYIVRILGEGSNGGNITHPAAVRDPLNTVFALIKLLVIRDTKEKKGLFHLWCTLSGNEKAYHDSFSFSDILETLPQWVTTSVYESDAMLKIKTLDHSNLKRKFQTVFLTSWESKKQELYEKWGFSEWIAISNNGTIQTEGLKDFGISGKGGLKIQFLGKDTKPLGYIWMRGSGTEPVFRILADARGNDIKVERMLLAWLTAMVLEADEKIL